MDTDFAMDPEFTSLVNHLQQSVGSTINHLYSAATGPVVAGFCMPLGPLAVGNMIPAVCETMATHCASGFLNGGTHVKLGVATGTTQADFTAAENA